MELQQAIEDSQLATLLQNDNSRLESIVAEGRSTLSGGEKQRIGVCRALLKNSSIYILDEATSALNAETEQKIVDTFKRVLKEKPL